jgi:hypothetical protein
MSSKNILPLFGSLNFVIKFNKVDLPTPDGPTNATTSPA